MYRKMYYFLFNAITTAIEEIRKHNYGNAERILMQAQQDAEEQYLSYKMLASSHMYIQLGVWGY